MEELSYMLVNKSTKHQTTYSSFKLNFVRYELWICIYVSDNKAYASTGCITLPHQSYFIPVQM